MPLALEITLIVVLVVLSLGLLPLLHQLRRTAKGLDVFLASSRKDLSQIAEDVHASRLRMDLLAATAQVSLAELSSFAKSVGEVGSAVKEFHARFRSSLESVSQIIGGASAVLAFFKSKLTQPAPE